MTHLSETADLRSYRLRGESIGPHRRRNTYYMDIFKKKSPVAASDRTAAAEAAERRRIGRIVHDDRGNATVDWLDAPADYERPVFELENQPAGLSIQKPVPTFNPYERATLPEPKKATAPKKDLKKLSEWIKMMRELEERKRSGELE